MAQPKPTPPANDTGAQPAAPNPDRRPRPVDLDPPTTSDVARDGKTKSKTKPARRRRHVLLRLFGISLWGWFRLIVLCVLVGFVVMAVNFDPRTVEVDVTSTVDTLVRNGLAAGTFLVQNFWQPALAGATVVIPLWVLWRLVSLPFRR